MSEINEDDQSAPVSSGLDARELQTRALRGVSWSSFSSVLALPLAIAVSVVVARTLGPEGYARFAYLTFIVPFFIALSDAGFAHATTRSVSQAFASGDLERTRELVAKALGWNLARLPFLCLLVLVIARPSAFGAVLVVAFLAVSTGSAGLVFALQAENRGATLAKLAIVEGLATGAAAIAAALSGAAPTTVWAASFAAGIVVAPGWLLATSPQLRRAALRPRLPRGLGVAFWRFGLLSLASSAGYVLVFSRSEIVILEALGEQQALAVFALAYGLSQRLTTPVDTLLGPLTTALSALHAAHPDRFRAGFERALRLSAVAVALLAAAAVVGTALLAPLMYGDDYAGVGLAFAGLATVSLLQSIAQPYTALAYASGRPALLLRALGIALVVDVAVAFALIPVLGLWGAVAANAAGGLTALALTVRSTAGPASLRLAQVPVARLALLTLTSCAAAYGAGLAGGLVHDAVGVLAAFAAGVISFLLLTLVAGGLLPRSDVDVIMRMLPIGGRLAARGAALVTRAET